MNRILNISDASSLGLHAVVYLAREPGGVATAHEIAACLKASEAHLSKVLQSLVRAGIVRSTRGPHGGFSLDCDPDRVSLLDVYEAVQGKLERTDCLFPTRVCGDSPCIFGDLLSSMSEKLRDHLSSTKLTQVNDTFMEVCA